MWQVHLYVQFAYIWNCVIDNQAWILDEVVCRLSTAFSVRYLTAIAQSIAISNMRYDEINALIITNTPIRTEHLLWF